MPQTELQGCLKKGVQYDKLLVTEANRVLLHHKEMNREWQENSWQ